jgi:hypothetical protein
MRMNNFRGRWTGRGGTQALTTSSPDLNPVDLVIWYQLNVSFTSTNEQIRIRPRTEFFAVLHLFQ